MGYLTPSMRPAVGVVVPFRGGPVAVERLWSALRCLALRDGDEVVVSDNTANGAAAQLARDPVRVVQATRERSAYHARNEGARAVSAEWILFLDADCRPSAGLLDAYFAEPIPGDCGALAGQILGEPGQRSFAARYARSRRLFDHADGLIRADGEGRPPGICSSAKRHSMPSAASPRGSGQGVTSTYAGDCRPRVGTSGSGLMRSSITDTAPRCAHCLLRLPATALAPGGSTSATPGPRPLGPCASAWRPRRAQRHAACGRGKWGRPCFAASMAWAWSRIESDMQAATAQVGSSQSSPGFREWSDSTGRCRRGRCPYCPSSTTARIAAAVLRMCSSESYCRRGQKNPRSPSLRLRGTR
jgi:hypothetical protein